jgi:hypothetical protein
MKLIIKKRLSKSEINAFSLLLKNNSPFLDHPSIISSSGYLNYFVNRIRISLSSKKSYLLILRQKETRGMALLRFMEWDSRFFKTPIGCIEYILVDKREEERQINEMQKELLNDAIDLAKELDFKILYVSFDSRRYSLVNATNSLKLGFICAELETAYTKRELSYLYVEEKLHDEYKFRRYAKKDYSQIINIAEEISEDVKSKFSLTAYLPQKEKDNYYLESIRNCCLGINADDIFVVVKNNAVAGFICYRHNKALKQSLGKVMSFTVMAGISRDERRKNIGTYLVACGHKQILKSSDMVLGRAYLHNLPMVRLISKMGLGENTKFIYTFCKKL